MPSARAWRVNSRARSSRMPFRTLLRIDLAAGLVADEQEAQAVVAEDLEARVRDVGLGVAGPRHAEPPEAARDGLRARQVVGEGVVVEEVLLDLREQPRGVRDLGHDVVDGPRAIALAAHRLRPQAERAARAAAAARVEGHVRMLQVADEVALDVEIAPVDVDDPRQAVHVLERRPLRRPPQLSGRVAVAQAGHLGQRPALGDLLDREVELGAAHEVERGRGGQGRLARHRDVGADETQPQAWVLALQRLGHLHVVREGRRARVQHREVVVARERHHVGEREIGGRRVDQARAGDERGRLGQPRRIPERADLPARLVPRAGAAIEPLERRWMQEERAEVRGHGGHLNRSPSSIDVEPSTTRARRQPRARQRRRHARRRVAPGHEPEAALARPRRA